MLTIAAIGYLDTEIKRELEPGMQSIPEKLRIKFVKVKEIRDTMGIKFDGVIIHGLANNRVPNFSEVVNQISKFN